MTFADPPVDYHGLAIDYVAIARGSKPIIERNLTLLGVAESEGLLEFVAALPDGEHYLVLCHGQQLVLTAEEVPGFVLGLCVAASKDLSIVAYRDGIRPKE